MEEGRAFVDQLRAAPDRIARPSRSRSGKFFVWSSEGYDNDGWHSYNGPPRKEFDSSWRTIEEANARVEYLFFIKNPWVIN